MTLKKVLLITFLFLGALCSPLFGKTIQAPKNGESTLELEELKTAPGDELVFYFTEYGITNSKLKINKGIHLSKKTKFRLLRFPEKDAFGKDGEYLLCTYLGKDPDLSNIQIVEPLFGKKYFFHAEKGHLYVRIETNYWEGSEI